MAAPSKPPDGPTGNDLDEVIADRLERAVERILSKTGNESAFGEPPPASIDKIVHNEITKLKANTLNAAAIAFFVGGVIAPLVSAVSQGLTFFQIVFGSVWLVLGFLLHFMAQRVLKRLQP